MPTDTEAQGTGLLEAVARGVGIALGMMLGLGITVVMVFGLQTLFPAFFAEYVPSFAEFTRMYLAAGKFALAVLLGPPGLMVAFLLYKRRVLDSGDVQ